MKNVGFEKSVRMFRKFSEETLRRRGGNQLGRDSVAALTALEGVLAGERWFDASLLEPVAAFTNLLQSSQLPPEFGGYSFGDALLAIEAAHAEKRGEAEQVWEFEGELGAEVASRIAAFAPSAPGLKLEPAHQSELERFILDGARSSTPGRAVVSCALAGEAVPFARLAEHFQKLVLCDVDLESLEALVRRAVPEALRARVELERYDASGCYGAFAAGVERVMQVAGSESEAAQELTSLLQTYDVASGSAGLTQAEGRADLAISVLGLSALSRGFAACVAKAFEARGWDARPQLGSAPLRGALELQSRLVEHHHVQALLRRASGALLVSAVSEVELETLPNGRSAAVGEPNDLLGVEHLVELLPTTTRPKAERSWECHRARDERADQKVSLLTLVEAVLV
jgi:hypothetical protein